MNFTAYIQRQKNIIRERHTGEVFLIGKEGVTQVNDSEKLFNDLCSFKGLNTTERLRYKNTCKSFPFII